MFTSAISTVLAIVAAIFAYRGVRTAWRSFELQHQQLNQSVELRRREQASKFCVWLEERGDSWAMMVHNASDLPVYDAYAVWDLGDPATWCGTIGDIPDHASSGTGPALLGDWTIGNVGPTSKARCVDGAASWLREGAAGCLDDASARFQCLLFPPGFETAFRNVCLRTYFTDAAGVRWERCGGRLVCHEAPPGGEIGQPLASVTD
jgi:hypothetical protein